MADLRFLLLPPIIWMAGVIIAALVRYRDSRTLFILLESDFEVCMHALTIIFIFSFLLHWLGLFVGYGVVVVTFPGLAKILGVPSPYLQDLGMKIIFGFEGIFVFVGTERTITAISRNYRNFGRI